MILIRTSKRILLPRLSRHLRTTRKHLEISLFQISTSDSSRYRTDHPVLPRRTDSRLCRGAENRTPSSCSQSKRTTGIRHPDTVLNRFSEGELGIPMIIDPGSERGLP